MGQRYASRQVYLLHLRALRIICFSLCLGCSVSAVSVSVDLFLLLCRCHCWYVYRCFSHISSLSPHLSRSRCIFSPPTSLLLCL